MSERWNVGDIVRPKKHIVGLSMDKSYEITHIDRCLDGATSWDDLYLYAAPGKYCEFDFERPRSFPPHSLQRDQPVKKIEELLKELQDHITADPLLIERVNSFVQASWSKYLAAEKYRRDRLAYNATTNMLYTFGKITSKDIPYLIDAVKFCYPNGWPEMACKSDEIFLEKFLKAMTEGNFTSEDCWIKDIKEFSELYIKLLAQQTERRKLI